MKKTCAAVVRERSGQFVFEMLDIDGPRETEVLVRIAACGVCHTDLAARNGDLPVPLPAVLGHEGAGIVEAVGAGVTTVREGDRVMLSYAYCGNCPHCARGWKAYCQHSRAINFGGARLSDGVSPYTDPQGKSVAGLFFGQSSFSTMALAYERNVVRVDADVPLEIAAAIGCGVQTGAGTVMNTLRPLPGSALVVFGVGTVGLAAVMASRASGLSQVIAVDQNDRRLELAHELGANVTLNPKRCDVLQKIREVCGVGAQYAIDTTGQPSVVRQAVECLRTTGVCAVVATNSAESSVELPLRQLISGRTVTGVVQGGSVSSVFIPALLQLWRQGRFPFDQLVTSFPMSQINEAFATMKRGDVVKAVLVNDLDALPSF